MSKPQNVDELIEDPICRKWMAYNASEDKNFPIEWYREKQSFWQNNQNYLEAKGFCYSSKIEQALGQIELMEQKGLEGSLLLVKVGSETYPANQEDIELAKRMMDEILEDVMGVRVLVVPHTFCISKIKLPQLRKLQSSVLASTDPEENINPIIEQLDLC